MLYRSIKDRRNFPNVFVPQVFPPMLFPKSLSGGLGFEWSVDAHRSREHAKHEL